MTLKLTELESMRLNTVRQSNRSINVLRTSTSESYAHVRKKEDIVNRLLSLKHNFITEAIFEKGGRADVLDLTEGIIYEVVHSESMQSIKDKMEVYPKMFQVVVVRTNE